MFDFARTGPGCGQNAGILMNFFKLVTFSWVARLIVERAIRSLTKRRINICFCKSEDQILQNFSHFCSKDQNFELFDR